MSGLVDTNILVYAVNQESPCHQKALGFLTELIEGRSTVYLCWAVLYEFLRVTTHVKVFSKPLHWEQSWKFLDSLLSQRDVHCLSEGEGHRETVQEVLRGTRDLRGNLMHDAHIAALLKENGVKTIYTCDSDFRLFPFLKPVDPFA